MDKGIENQAIHTPSLFEVCSDALSEVLRWYVLLFSLNTRYFVLPQHKAVIDIVIPQIAHMKPLAEEAISTCDYEMCKRIVLIFIQLGNDYILPVMDDSNTLKEELLQTLLTLYSFPSMDIAELCVDFWLDLLTVLSPPDANSPVYLLLRQLIDASLPHLVFPEVGPRRFFHYRIHKPCPLRIDMNSRSNVVPLESVLEKSMIHRM